MNESLTITNAQLYAAMVAWVNAYRSGETKTHDEADALPLEQVAQESARHLWSLLGGENVKTPLDIR